jgi:hypothetical protein
MDDIGYIAEDELIGQVQSVPEDGDGNQAPVCEGVSVVTPEDTPILVDLCADPDGGDGLTYEIVGGGPSNGTTGPGSFEYTPNGGFTGTDFFTYRACDSEPLCSTAVPVFVTVGGEGPPPVGDCDDNGVVTIADALWVAQIWAGLADACPGDDGDVDGGGISISDALLIAQYWAGLISSLPPP